MDSSPAAGARAYYAAFFAGAWVRRMVAFVVVLYGYNVLGGGRWSGLLYFCLVGPYLLSVWAGRFIDVSSKRVVLHGTSALAVLLLVALTVCVGRGGLPSRPWLIAALIGGYGVVAAVAFPAFLTVVPDVFGCTQVSRASAVTNVLSMLCHVCGPLTVALIRWRLSWWPVFAAFAAISAAGWAWLAAVPLPSDRRGAASDRARRAPAAGLAVVCRTQPGLVSILLALVVFSVVVAGPLEVLAPLFGQVAGGGGALGTGGFVAVGGIGLFLGAICALRLVERPRLGTWLCGAGVMGSVLLVAMTWAPVWCAFVVFFCAGLLGGVFTSLCVAGIQARAPDQDRGRILGLYSLILGGAPALGGYVSGKLVDAVGIPAAIRAVFGVAAAAYVLLYLCRADLRDTSSAANGIASPAPLEAAAVGTAT